MDMEEILKSMKEGESFKVTKTGHTTLSLTYEVTVEVQHDEGLKLQTSCHRYAARSAQDTEFDEMIEGSVALSIEGLFERARRARLWVVMQNDYPMGASADREKARKMAKKLRKEAEQHNPHSFETSFIRVYEYRDGVSSSTENTETF